MFSGCWLGTCRMIDHLLEGNVYYVSGTVLHVSCWLLSHLTLTTTFLCKYYYHSHFAANKLRIR